MDPFQVLQTLAALWFLTHRAVADSKTEKSILEALADADRYAGGYADSSYVADAWERAADGWVRGGYTLVSGDTRTSVRYTVSPLGEMRVMARRPGGRGQGRRGRQQQQQLPATAATATATTAAGSRVLQMLQRLHHHLDSELVEDDDASFDDILDDDDDPFFLDGPDASWSSLPLEWSRLTRT